MNSVKKKRSPKYRLQDTSGDEHSSDEGNNTEVELPKGCWDERSWVGCEAQPRS
jgi:hypothetical protein